MGRVIPWISFGAAMVVCAILAVLAVRESLKGGEQSGAEGAETAPNADKWAPGDAGCLIGGHHGWRAHCMMVDLAIESGYPISDDHQAMLGRYCNDPCDEDAADVVLNELLDEADCWLNSHVAPDNHAFGWHEGEYWLMPDEWWQDEENDEIFGNHQCPRVPADGR